MVAVKSMCCMKGVAMIDKMGCKSEKYEVSNTTPPLDSADSKHPVVMCYGICSFDSNSMKSPNPHSGFYDAKTSRTLDLNGGNPACNQGGVLVVTYKGQDYEAGCFKGNQGAKAASVAFVRGVPNFD